ncbi:4'-phosphopantetheinyl transferase superfamily protein [Polaribacter sp. Hel1_33_78]|uniref:4'-phosphopantetheinyl transferase family protein n=1 Tax=Polaribacter sp. Hel1_33_78 TaxID=1336804 RepID=UPI00087C7A89|nr:4'-phosphopantetheinyl transferase superfamily protein [Polaribacter sp. Hel1_33_78]MDG2437555.1 4'-phosphopantetheinyl transferase superfamily protein [Polaribacter sp.]SDT86932.1 4'-phosphopantetheinyl transferase superfamily protein [Polaribacter sp. Hel1_33_78]
MIGNDIVDLKLAKNQSNWQRKGFLEKQFTEEEQKTILNSNDPFSQVWLFWSMKEAAYKCYTQRYKKRFFGPKKFICKMISKTLGYISIDREVYFSTTIITENYIHTIASERKEVSFDFSFVTFDHKTDQTTFLNNSILAFFSGADTVQKDKFGIPFLYNQQRKIPVSLSTSHHGNFGGFVILKNQWT